MLPLDSVRVFHFSVLVMPDPPSSFPSPQLRIPSLSVSRSPAVDHFVFACYFAFYCDFDIRLGNSFFSSQILDLRADPFSFASPRRLGCMRFRSAPGSSCRRHHHHHHHTDYIHLYRGLNHNYSRRYWPPPCPRFLFPLSTVFQRLVNP